MGSWKLTCVNNHTQKTLYLSMQFLWLILFPWTSKDVRWSNNNRCSKVKLIWKLIFLCHFIMPLVPIIEIRFTLSKQQDVESTDRFPDLCNWMVFQQLIWVTGYTKIPYGLYFPTIRKDIWLLLNYTGKTIAVESFLKLALGQNQRMKMQQKMIITGVFSSKEIIDKAPIINIFDILAKTKCSF